VKRAPRLWRGTLRVDALLFDRAAGAEVTRRILAAWEPGCLLTRCEEGWFLRFGKARWLRAQEAPGQVFVRVVALWSALQIDVEGTARWPSRSLLRARGGRIVAEPLAEQVLDAAALLDLSAFVLEPLAPLVPLVVTSPRARVAPVEAPPSTRQILEVGEAAEEASLFARTLVSRGDAAGTGTGTGEESAIATALQAAMRWFRGGAGGGAPEGPGRKGGSGPAGPPPETPISDAIRSFMNRVILSTRLASVLGRQQAQYMADLVDMLERQRFDEALRFAIPLTDDVVTALGKLTFGRPSMRTDYSLNLGRAQPSTVMVGGGDVGDQLRMLYRRAAEQLEREGKIERAAFVLADLLNLPEEAVSLLERHGHFRLAARLAEARNLDPSLLVRQWLLAGDRARAIALARRYEAYEVAVARLVSAHPELAATLRVDWAEALAARGAFAAASEAIWPVEKERDRARTWLDEAIARRGVAGARALARKLTLVDEERPETLRQIADVLAEEDMETATVRMMLVTTLAAKDLPPNAEVRSALRLGLRSWLRDGSSLGRMVKPAELQAIAKATGDGALRADLPALPSYAPRAWVATVQSLSHSVDAADRGMSNVLDAVILEDGAVAVALGEQGCVLMHRDGRVVARLSEPAYRFVQSDLRDRALALAPRNEVWRIARLDFVKRHAAYWRDVRLDAFTDTYDGATWFAAVDGALYAIDTTAERLTSIWYSPDVGPAVGMARTPSAVAVLNADRELWQYEIPSYLLRIREQIISSHANVLRALLPGGAVVEAQFAERERTVVRTGRGSADRVIGVFEGVAAGLVAHERWIAAIVRRNDDSHVALLEPSSGRQRVAVALSGSKARVRIQAEHLLAFDDAGRIVVVDLEQGAVIRDLRI
jgi:hypothetical protein